MAVRHRVATNNKMTVLHADPEVLAHQQTYLLDIKKRSDKFINYFLAFYYLTGIALSFYYDTWLIGLSLSTISVVAYYSIKWLLPESDLYQYVLSAVLGLFLAQFIYQMHGMFEMHFFAFISSAVLITYQKWKLQIPLLIVVGIHHATFSYLQNVGYGNVFFTTLKYFDNTTLVIHLLLTGVIFFISGLWAYQLDSYGEQQILNNIEVSRLQKEAILNEERKRNEAALKKFNQELLATNRDLELARKEAEQANKAKSIFLATMSHEIRTPMNGVLGMAALLTETPLTEQQRTYAEAINTCGENLLTVINDILDFSKIEAGNLELDSHDFDLRNAMEDVLDIFATSAARKQLEVALEIAEDVPRHIVGDRVRLQQILTNLIGNAIKFTSTGEVIVRAAVISGGEDIDGTIGLKLSVRDTGIGIAPDKVGRLFTAFSQADSSTTRKYGGTGLGLAISRRLTELMHGEIWVDSTPGTGSEFSFTIRTQKGQEVPPPYTVFHISRYAGKSVLVVDDNQTNLTILEQQLLNWKLKPLVAPSADEALKLLAGGQIDLVITDAQMPEVDGVELARRIKASHPQLPVILLSSIGDERNMTDTGLFEYVLTKPVKQQLLGKYISQSLSPKTGAPKEEAANKFRLSPDFALHYPFHILVAEDNRINQMVIMQILSKLGYAPDLANNGIEVLAMLAEKLYDLVLMDVHMPDMDGLEATRLIRKNMDSQPLILALTANAMIEDREECLAAGMDDYIGKPVKFEDLMTKLRKLYNRNLK